MLKNIIFDVGNVLVKWDPQDIVTKVFPSSNVVDLTQKIFKSSIWFDLNKGFLTEQEAILNFHETLNIPYDELTCLMREIKISQIPIEGSFELLEDLSRANIPLYCITDNIREIIEFLKNRYTFFDKFMGVTVSADLGVLKPDPVIYKSLLETYHLKPHESIFIDDLEKNVEGAKALGMESFQFIDAHSCRKELTKKGFNF